MIQQIKTVDDVKTFFETLKEEGLNFHPDDLMQDYIYIDTGLPFYSDQEALVRDRLLTQAFDVCDKANVDIDELCMDIFQLDFLKE